MLALMVEHQAGIPLLMQPLSGHSRDAHDFGEAVRAHLQQWHTTDGMTSLVADSALDRSKRLPRHPSSGSCGFQQP
jgi:transposase